MEYTLKGLIECLTTSGVNSKALVINALRNASSYDLKGFRNDINKEITLRTIQERKGE